jgi:hypothetical protein
VFRARTRRNNKNHSAFARKPRSQKFQTPKRQSPKSPEGIPIMEIVPGFSVIGVWKLAFVICVRQGG